MGKRPLVITADDVGLTQGINEGVVELIHKKRLRNVSLMVNMPHFGHAIKLLKPYPHVSCGLHFNLFEGRSLSQKSILQPILGPGNRFKHSLSALVAAFIKNPGLGDAVKQELHKQFEQFTNSGIVPTHIDVHKFLAWTPVIGLTAQFAQEKKIPYIRWPYDPSIYQKEFLSLKQIFSRAGISAHFVSVFSKKIQKNLTGVKKIPCTGISLIGEWSKDQMVKILAHSKAGAIEIVMHPGKVTRELYGAKTRLIHEREAEMAILLSDAFGEALTKYSWQISGFGDL